MYTIFEDKKYRVGKPQVFDKLPLNLKDVGRAKDNLNNNLVVLKNITTGGLFVIQQPLNSNLGTLSPLYDYDLIVKPLNTL